MESSLNGGDAKTHPHVAQRVPSKGYLRRAMDSVLSSVRGVVSADKSRFSDGTYDLDLSYITDRVIAMAYPASGFEATYRNNIVEVAALLKERHDSGFKVYNLCSERPCYPTEPFEERVVHWGFPDHHAPPLYLLMRICRSMFEWLTCSPNNVCVVHCLAGKGRTGVVVSAFLLYVGLFSNADSALAYFASRRSQNNWGCTNPSQVESVRRFAQIMNRKIVPNSKSKVLHRVAMTPLPLLDFYGHAPCLHILITGARQRVIFKSTDALGGMLSPMSTQQRTWTLDHLSVPLRGDVTFEFMKETARGGIKPFCYFSLHIGMIAPGDQVITLTKYQIDDAFKDSRFSVDFKVELGLVDFEDVVGGANVSSNNDNNTALIGEELEARLRRATLSSRLATGEVALEDEFWERDTEHLYDGSIVFSGDEANVKQKVENSRSMGTSEVTLMGRGGYLTKLGSNVKNWKQRWFTLRAGQLAYFKSPRDTTPAGSILLNEVQAIQMLDNPLLQWDNIQTEVVLNPKMEFPIVCGAMNGVHVWVACENGSVHLWNSETSTLLLQNHSATMVDLLLSSSHYGMFAAYADGALQLLSCAYVSLTDVVMTIPPILKDCVIVAMCMVPDPKAHDDPAEMADPSLLCVARSNGSLTLYRPPLVDPVACFVLPDVKLGQFLKAILADRESMLWVGLVGSILIIDIKTLEQKTIVLKGATSIVAAMSIHGDLCYCASRDGLVSVISVTSHHVINVVPTGNPIYCMVLVRETHLWLGNAGGCTICDFSHLQGRITPLRFTSSRTNDPFCVAFTIDRGSGVWFGADTRLTFWKYKDLHTNMFQIFTSRRPPLIISAPNEKERVDWIEAIEWARLGETQTLRGQARSHTVLE